MPSLLFLYQNQTRVSSKLHAFCLSLGNMKQKIIIKVQMDCDKCRSKALKIAAQACGVISVAIEGADNDRLVVVGEGVDTACLTKLLKKKIGCASIISVEEVKPKPPEVKKPECTKPKCCCPQCQGTSICCPPCPTSQCCPPCPPSKCCSQCRPSKCFPPCPPSKCCPQCPPQFYAYESVCKSGCPIM